MVVPARGLDPITSTMHYPHHQEDANAFRVSNDFYEFSKCSENLRYRTPSKPVFDIPLETTSTENPLKLSKFFCNCRYLWLRELHGLSTTMMSNSLKEKLFWSFVIVICGLISILNANVILGSYYDRSSTLITFVPVKEMNFPALVFCPKNADGLQYDSLYEDFVANVGYADNNTADEVIQYIIAGSGFDNVDVTRWSDEDKMELNNLYNTWRANRTVLEMFDFIFNQNGYRCDEFFDSCWAGSQILNCCEIFKPVYVMLRGRCFRLVDDYKQKDVDENAKISIQLNNVQTGSLTGRKNRIQVVLYIGDAYQEVGIYPRVYLNYHDWNRLRFVQRRLSMLPNNPQCSLAPLNQGKSTCFVYNWLMRVVVNPLNCTVPYFKGMLPYVDDVPSCEPLLLVNNYANITSTILENYHCLPACERIENHMQMTTSPDYSRQFSYSFRVEASFTDLQYESYSEIRLTSPAGFISELGGQSGLFVGCSVMSFVQLILSVLSLFVIFARKIYVRYFSLALNVKVIPADDIVENVPIK